VRALFLVAVVVALVLMAVRVVRVAAVSGCWL
jgi:hypothetical protein